MSTLNLPGVLTVIQFASRRRAISVFVIVLPGLWVVAGCGQPVGAGPGHRTQPLALTPEQELEIGREAAENISQRVPIDRDPAMVERVQQVSQRIAQAVKIEPLDREINLQVADVPFEWEYHVVDADEVNAFCLPGGKIFVFRGMLKTVQNDDQLAAVVAHEVAHAVAHHVSERIARQAQSGGGLWALQFDRQQESEADHIGVFFVAFAGYDPEQTVAFWQKMQAVGRNSVRLPEILSDHPSDARRIAQIKQWVPLAEAAKHAYDTGHIEGAPTR